MRIKNIVKRSIVYFYVETDQAEFPDYRRSVAGNWERDMGDRWEWDHSELEKAFQEFMATQLPPALETHKSINLSRVPFEELQVKAYIDRSIRFWRGKKAAGDSFADYYIDAFQSIRRNIFGELLPLDPSEPPESLDEKENP